MYACIVTFMSPFYLKLKKQTELIGDDRTLRAVVRGDADSEGTRLRPRPHSCVCDVGDGYTDKSYVKVPQATHLIL